MLNGLESAGDSQRQSLSLPTRSDPRREPNDRRAGTNAYPAILSVISRFATVDASVHAALRRFDRRAF